MSSRRRSGARSSWRRSGSASRCSRKRVSSWCTLGGGVYGAESCRSCHNRSTTPGPPRRTPRRSPRWRKPTPGTIRTASDVTSPESPTSTSWQDVNIAPEVWNVQCEECHGSGTSTTPGTAPTWLPARSYLPQVPRSGQQPGVRLRAVQELRRPLTGTRRRPSSELAGPSLRGGGLSLAGLAACDHAAGRSVAAPGARCGAWGAANPRDHQPPGGLEDVGARHAGVGFACRALALGARLRRGPAQGFATKNEPPRHYIDIDHFEPHGRFRGQCPRTREGHGEEVRQGAGRGQVGRRAVGDRRVLDRMVVMSLEVGDWGSAGAWAADLGHYVADTHQPLHVHRELRRSEATGNRGVHLRFEVHMMNRHFHEEAIRIGEPLGVLSREPRPEATLRLDRGGVSRAGRDPGGRHRGHARRRSGPRGPVLRGRCGRHTENVADGLR